MEKMKSSEDQVRKRVREKDTQFLKRQYMVLAKKFRSLEHFCQFFYKKKEYEGKKNRRRRKQQKEEEKENQYVVFAFLSCILTFLLL